MARQQVICSEQKILLRTRLRETKTARSGAIQDALRSATEPPMCVVESAVDVCRLAAELVDFGNPNAISDVGCAALFANAAAQGAALNVGINAKSLKEQMLRLLCQRRKMLCLSRLSI